MNLLELQSLENDLLLLQVRVRELARAVAREPERTDWKSTEVFRLARRRYRVMNSNAACLKRKQKSND